MTQIQIKNLLDPKARYLFLEQEGLVQALRIRGVIGDSIVLDDAGDYAGQVGGFFIAANGRGIVRYRGQLMGVDSQPGLSYLKMELGTLQVINRREFNRYRLRSSPPVLFKYDGRLVKAELIDLSEGGCRVRAMERLPSPEIYQLEIKLAAKKTVWHFKTDGLVVYSEPELDPQYFMTGLCFVTPTFKQDLARTLYLATRAKLSAFVGQHPELFNCSGD